MLLKYAIETTTDNTEGQQYKKDKKDGCWLTSAMEETKKFLPWKIAFSLSLKKKETSFKEMH